VLSLSDSQDCCSLWSTMTQLSSLTPPSTLHRPLPRVYRLSSCGRRSIGCRDNCVGVGGDRDTDDVTLLQSVEHACPFSSSAPLSTTATCVSSAIVSLLQLSSMVQELLRRFICVGAGADAVSQ
jgi:hypothetical protein